MINKEHIMQVSQQTRTLSQEQISRGILNYLEQAPKFECKAQVVEHPVAAIRREQNAK